MDNYSLVSRLEFLREVLALCSNDMRYYHPLPHIENTLVLIDDEINTLTKVEEIESVDGRRGLFKKIWEDSGLMHGIWNLASHERASNNVYLPSLVEKLQYSLYLFGLVASVEAIKKVENLFDDTSKYILHRFEQFLREGSILIMDMTASTKLWGRSEVSYSGLMPNLFEIERLFSDLKNKITYNGGNAWHTQGDMIIAFFDKPDMARQTACEIQMSLNIRKNLFFKIGLHHGKIIDVHGNFIGTPDVIIAHRAMEKSEGNIIIATEKFIEKIEPKILQAEQSIGIPPNRIHLKTGEYLRIYEINKPIIKECKYCLLNTRVEGVKINEKGLCYNCELYRQNIYPEVLEKELGEFLNATKDRNSQYDCMVEFSGGRNSVVALYLAVKQFGLKPLAVTIDNGFIPEHVLNFSKAFCKNLNISHIIVKTGFLPNVLELYKKDFANVNDLCALCDKYMNYVVLSLCREMNIPWSLNGNTKFRTLKPVVSGKGRISSAGSPGKNVSFTVSTLNLPFVLQLTRGEEEEILKNIGWKPPSISGYSTNCLLPGFTEAIFKKRLGYHPSIKLISAEILSGYMERETGKEIINAKTESRESEFLDYMENRASSCPPSSKLIISHKDIR